MDHFVSFDPFSRRQRAKHLQPQERHARRWLGSTPSAQPCKKLLLLFQRFSSHCVDVSSSKVWDDAGCRAALDCCIYRPIPQYGYHSLGDVAFRRPIPTSSSSAHSSSSPSSAPSIGSFAVKEVISSGVPFSTRHGPLAKPVDYELVCKLQTFQPSLSYLRSELTEDHHHRRGVTRVSSCGSGDPSLLETTLLWE